MKRQILARSHSQRRGREIGLTLVELMVAMTLALAIVAAVGYVYLQGKQGFAVQDSRSRLQESARLAYSVMSRDIVSGGYFGCVKPEVDNSSGVAVSSIRITAAQPLMTANISWLELDNDETDGFRSLNPEYTVRGFDNGANWPVDSTLAATRLANTDTLLILKAGEDARHLTGTLSSQTLFNVTSAMTGATTNTRARPMVISNCEKGEIIKPTIELAGTQFNVANNLNRNLNGSDTLTGHRLRYDSEYDESSMVTIFDPVTYYVAPAPGKNGTAVPSLRRMVTMWDTPTSAQIGLWNSAGGDVVVEGVEQMQIRYFAEGASANTSLGPFTAAEMTAGSRWLSLVAVRVDLTLVGDDDNVRTTTTTQTVGTNSVTDAKIRLATSFTVNLRVPKT
jgi:Tfp pilus assembly protein PilW